MMTLHMRSCPRCISIRQRAIHSVRSDTASSKHTASRDENDSRQDFRAARKRLPPNHVRKEAAPFRKTYHNALRLLSTLRFRNHILPTPSLAQGPLETKNKDARFDLLYWFRKVGYEPEDLARYGLKFIQVAGTDGRETVCAMIESMFKNYQSRDGQHVKRRPKGLTPMKGSVGSALARIGVLTSVHTVTPRERIRVNGHMITQIQFKKYFWDIWKRIPIAAREANGDAEGLDPDAMPDYVTVMTIIAFRFFVECGVGTAVMETAIGGELDRANVLLKDLVMVSGITSIGIDHTTMLGNTVEEVALHEAGIMKQGVPAFTVEQQPSVQEVLDSVSRTRENHLTVVKMDKVFQDSKFSMRVDGAQQKKFASLAIAIARQYMESRKLLLGPLASGTELPVRFMNGLQAVYLPARCHTRQFENTEWCLDGGNTMERIEATAEWFASKMDAHAGAGEKPTQTWLIFTTQLREPVALLHHLLSSIRSLLSHKAFKEGEFTFDNIAIASSHSLREKLQQEDSDNEQWHAIRKSGLLQGSRVIHATLDEVMERVRNSTAVVAKERVTILVSGSLHTAGMVLKMLNGLAKNRNELLTLEKEQQLHALTGIDVQAEKRKTVEKSRSKRHMDWLTAMPNKDEARRKQMHAWSMHEQHNMTA